MSETFYLLRFGRRVARLPDPRIIGDLEKRGHSGAVLRVSASGAVDHMASFGAAPPEPSAAAATLREHLKLAQRAARTRVAGAGHSNGVLAQVGGARG